MVLRFCVAFVQDSCSAAGFLLQKKQQWTEIKARNHHAFQENSRFWSASRVGDFQGEMSAESYVCRLQESESVLSFERPREFCGKKDVAMVWRRPQDGRKCCGTDSGRGMHFDRSAQAKKNSPKLAGAQSAGDVVCMQPRGTRPTSRLVCCMSRVCRVRESRLKHHELITSPSDPHHPIHTAKHSKTRN